MIRLLAYLLINKNTNSKLQLPTANSQRLFFQPLVEPTEELALPEHGVLRFGDKVAFIGEEEEAAGDSLHLGHVVCLHALGVWDAEVVAAMDDENRGVPVAHEMVR